MTDEEILRRHFVAIATGEYEDPNFPPLAVADEVKAMQRWLCASGLGGRRFQVCHPELAANPTKGQIRDALESPPPGSVWRDADAAVVFVTGHGEVANDTHYLILKSTDTGRLHATALPSADLIWWLAETRIQHLLLIFDACYAGQIASDIVRLEDDPPPGWLVLSSTTKKEKAECGALTQAISAFLTELASREGRSYGTGKYLVESEFLRGVRDKLKLDGRQTARRLTDNQPGEPHFCLPNPHYRAEAVEVAAARHDLALPYQELDLKTHWGPKALGVAGDNQPGWLFTGRAALMRKLIDTATGLAGVTVVTGRAGSGKTAVLARLVTLSDPGFRTKYAAEVAAIPDDLRPPSGAVDVAVLATGKLGTEILKQICDALGVPARASASQREPTVEERLEDWHHWLTNSPRMVTIVVDALDEAGGPSAVVGEVLGRLDPDPQQPRIRLLVGVRSPADQRITPPAVVGRAEARRLAVDEPPWWDQNDLIGYVVSVLRSTKGSPYRAAPAGWTYAIASALAQRAGRSFLIAQVAASALAARDTVVAADDPELLAALDQGVTGVFRQDLHRSLHRPTDRHRAVVLLRAVAYARGAGLPWRDIWPTMAHAVDEAGGYYGDTDIAWLLDDSRLGGYLVTDTRDHITVYRLIHDQLRTVLRDDWRELLKAPLHDPALR